MPRRPPRMPEALLRARVPGEVVEVLRRLDAAGHRSWLVGGVVRDRLLRRPHGGDHDVATPARPEAVLALFPRAIPTGIDHGTVTVLWRGHPVEVTTFRGEGAYLDGRRPSSVTFLSEVDADLARRDFTINAMAWDPLAPDFRDPFGGREDLRRRRVRAVGEPSARFAEDGLRPLRAARFAAQLGFTLAPATRAAIPPALPVVAKVSAERVCDELSKLLLAPHADRGLALLEGCGLLGVVLPELAALPPRARAHGQRAAVAAPPELAVRLAALLHPLALAQPAEAAAEQLRQALVRLRFPGAVVALAAALVRIHGCLAAPSRAPAPATPAALRRLLCQAGRERAAALFDLWEADAAALGGRRGPGQVRAARALRRQAATLLRAATPLSTGELALDGQVVMRQLGIPPGPEVGEALRHLLDRVIEDPALNSPGGLESILRVWWLARAR